jgi:hypothetical protein
MNRASAKQLAGCAGVEKKRRKKKERVGHQKDLAQNSLGFLKCIYIPLLRFKLYFDLNSNEFYNLDTPIKTK